MKHALTIDLEDWHQIVEWKVRGRLPGCSPHVVGQTETLLQDLADAKVKATFFVLGMVAQAQPGLVRSVAEAGHEIASHGWSHRLVYQQEPDEFRQETRKSKELLEQLTGRPCRGYRAAEFSLIQKSLWALDILGELGFAYDSSIFPAEGRRYGIQGTPLGAHVRKISGGNSLLEIPPSVLAWGGRLWPVAGGGYFRLAPWTLTRWAIRQMEKQGRAAVAYFHPYDFSSSPLRLDRQTRVETFRHPQLLGFHNSFRKKNRQKFRRLLGCFSWGTLLD